MTSPILEDESEAPRTPDWYPGWASELANLYFAANTCLFVIHGNVNDLVYCKSEDKDGKSVDRFCGLTNFLSEQVFGSWDVVTSYDMGRGIQAQAGPDADRHRDMMATLSKNIGSPTQWTRSPDDALENFNRMIQRNLLEDDAKERKRMAFLFPYAQFMVPAGDQASVARSQASRLVRFLSWAQNPYIKRVNISFCLIAETLTEVNKRLVEDAHVATIEVPLPDEKTRRLFIETNYDLESDSAKSSEKSDGDGEAMSVDAVTQISNGLNLVNLNTAMSRSKLTGKGVDINAFRKLKKGLIERQCHDLVTFLEPGHTLDMVVGHDAAKDRLRLDARWIVEGRLDAAPMGYLICGPVGTGKRLSLSAMLDRLESHA